MVSTYSRSRSKDWLHNKGMSIGSAFGSKAKNRPILPNPSNTPCGDNCGSNALQKTDLPILCRKASANRDLGMSILTGLRLAEFHNSEHLLTEFTRSIIPD